MSAIIKVTVVGAGGKMGTRVTNNLAKHPDAVDLRFCESGEAGIAARAAALVRVQGEADVRRVLQHESLRDAPKLVLGGGSNLLFAGDHQWRDVLRDGDLRLKRPCGDGCGFHDGLLG